MTRVVLHGRLADQFGAEHRFVIDRSIEALRALECAFPGRFLAALREGGYRVVRGDILHGDFSGDRQSGGVDLSLDMLGMRAGGKTLHIVPVVAGAKRGGAVKVVLGVALIAAAVAFSGPGAGFLGSAMGEAAFTVLGGSVTWGNIAMMGVSMALQGASSLLSPQPKAQKSFEAADRRASFLFAGPVTAVEQGGAVPVIYGRVRAGGTVISAALAVEDIAGGGGGGGGGGGSLTISAMEPGSLHPGQTSTGGLVVTSGFSGRLRLASVVGGVMLTAAGGDLGPGSEFEAAQGAAGLRFRMAAAAVTAGSWVIEALNADGSVAATQTGSVPLFVDDPITGAKGGGKGGGSGGRVAQEDANTLRARSTARVLYLIGEGELELVDGGKSIYLDDTPIIAADGTANIDGVTWEWRSGTPDQPHVAGFAAAESESAVGIEVKKSSPVIRTVTDGNADAVRVTVQIPALTTQDKSSGDLHGGRVEIAVDVRPAGGSWTEATTSVFEGKCTAPYARAFRVALPAGGAPWDIRVRRLTDDHADDTSQQDKTYWQTMAVVVDGKFSYPDSAYLALTFDAEKYDGRLPTISVDVRRVGLQIPANYDPVTRTYTGVWDGTFKRGKHDNPAWVLWDILTDDRYGLGGVLPAATLDKWGLCQIARYCDQPIPSGYKDAGGADILEPRFVFDTVFAGREEAFSVVQAICSAFRGMAFWAAGAVFASADMPEDPVLQVAPANVVDGVFTYSGTGLKARHSVAKITWTDPADGWRPAIEVVEEPDLVARYGWREMEVTAVGCSRRSQAHRLGRWLLLTAEAETHTVTYSTGLDHLQARPGQIVQVADPAWAGVRMGGRLRAATPTSATLDALVLIEAGKSYVLSVAMPDGSLAERAIAPEPGETALLTWGAPLDVLPVGKAVWVLTASDLAPRQFRIRAVRETGPGRYEVTALLHDPTKYARIEQGLVLEPEPTVRPDSAIAPPTGLTCSEARYTRNGAPRSRLTLSWVAPVDPLLTGYGLTVRWPTGRVEDRQIGKTVSLDIDDAEIGPWSFSLRARSLTGQTSRAATLAFTSAGWEDIPGLSVSHLTVDGGHDGAFVTRDPRFAWRGNFPDSTWEFGAEPAAGAGRIDPRFRDYVVRVYAADTAALLRTEYTTANSWIYTLEMNRQDSRALGRAAARRRFVVGVAIRDTSWRESPETRLEVENVAPGLPVNLQVLSAVGAAHVLFDLPSDGDFAGTAIHKGGAADFAPTAETLAARGTSNAYVVPVDPNTGCWIMAGHYDIFGEDEMLYSAAIRVGGTYVVDTISPDIPTGLTLATAIADGRPQITAAWDACAAADFAYFETAIKTAGGGDDQWQFGRVADPRCVWSSGLIAAVTYQLKVRAVDTSTNASGWSATASVIAARDTVPPGPITGVDVSPSFRSIWITWTNPPEADYSHAEVWEGAGPDRAAAVRIGTVNGAPGARSVLDRSGLEPGVTRHYWLRPVDTSENIGDWTAAVSALTASLQLPDFPAEFGPIPTGNTLPTTAPAGPVDLFFKTPECVLYRWRAGAWERAIRLDEATGQITSTQISDGAVRTPHLAAGAVTAGTIAAGAVTADSLAANAVTAGKIQAGAITADKLAASNVITTSAQIANAVIGDAHISSLDASRIRAGSALAGSITVNGQSLGGLQQAVGDPAAAINTGSTQIDPGRVRISAGATLADWRYGPNQTEINGGAVAANTVTANKLFIGARGVTAQGFSFRPSTARSDIVAWDAGSIMWIDDAGNYARSDVSGGATSDFYIYWVRGENALRTTNDTATAKTPTGILLCTNHRGGFIVPHMGGSLIDGSRIVTESIRASEIAANAIQTNHISAQAVQAQHVAANAIAAQQIVAGAVDRSKLALRVVGAAQIDDLSVDRAHIRDLTVNGQKIEDFATSNVAGASGTTSATVSMTTTGRPVVVIIVRGCMQRAWFRDQDGTSPKEVNQPTSLAWAEVQQPGAGTHSWTANNGSGWPTYGWSQAYDHYCAIIVIELRK
jgi:predicted phage tail protein